MSNTLNKDKLQTIANERAKEINTPDDLRLLSAILTKMTVEAALSSEMDHHLGYEKSQLIGHNDSNSRNGYSTKILKGDHGEVDIQTPRDREGTFEP